MATHCAVTMETPEEDGGDVDCHGNTGVGGWESVGRERERDMEG